MIKRFLIFILVVLPLLIGPAVFGAGYYFLKLWKYEGPSTTFTVSSGEPFSKINYRLQQSQLISSAKVFHHYAQYLKKMTKFKAGKFAIPSNINMVELLNILLYGTPLSSRVTIPEGKNIFEIATILKENNIIKSKERFIELSKNRDVVAALGITADRIEGYLYPDTYSFTENSEEITVIRAMVANHKKVVSNLDFSYSNLSPEQIITLASVVEKETGAQFERPIISGVFHNRLKKRMRLQSDPTTIYGIFETFNGNLRKDDLLTLTPYNTYKIPGLPVGPICNPGIEAIKAALNPEIHDYLYFVSRNDGTHIFTKTYRDHLNAVEEWQKNRSNRTGKSWRDLKK